MSHYFQFMILQILVIARYFVGNVAGRFKCSRFPRLTNGASRSHKLIISFYAHTTYGISATDSNARSEYEPLFAY
jgi:hypothetical protein